VKPAPFAYYRARSVDEAVALLSSLGEDAKVIAGGQSLVPMMNLRLARPTALVDILAIPGLSYIHQDAASLRIGALTTHRAIERQSGLADGFALLPTAACWVGHYPIRTRGTFGGSIAHADPSAEWCMLARLYDAELVVVGSRGRRLIAADDFFSGMFNTDLTPDELLVDVRLPRSFSRGALHEFARRYGDFAIVAAAVGLDVVDGRCSNVRIVLGGVASRAERTPEAEDLLNGADVDPAAFAEAAEVAASTVEPPGDIHGSSEYRRHLVRVLVRRALDEATREKAVDGARR
jgi:carbon-monoxide dehydrogenase medium subunit